MEIDRDVGEASPIRVDGKTLANGVVQADTITRVRGETRLPVNVAELVYVNALAPAGRSPVKYRTRVHELALITTYPMSRSDDALALKVSDFRSSSLHIKRFVSESMGLGMLTAALEALYWREQQKRLFNFDALPVALAREFAKRGPRPDLLFDFGDARVAGEARGRRRGAPTEPRREQRNRLNSLLAWSHHHGGHAMVMSWACLTSRGVTVDLYTRPDEISWLLEDFGEPIPPEPTLEYTDLLQRISAPEATAP